MIVPASVAIIRGRQSIRFQSGVRSARRLTGIRNGDTMTNLTQAEFDAVVSLAMANDERHAAFILFSYYHAARRQEALALRGTDVINGTVRFKRAKQRKDAIVSVQPLFTRERELVEKYAVQAGSGRVFPYSAGYASRMVRAYLTKAGAYTQKRQ